MLEGSKVLLGICGSIAAYKSAFLTRQLIKAGAEVQVIMTDDATGFVAPITFATLSRKPVLSDFISENRNDWNNHVELGIWADIFLIAPASANTVAKMANGICDNLLLATYLSAKCPVWLAPAMDLDMWQHPATQANIERLQSFGHNILAVGHGELASGLTGPGRMMEPESIVEALQDHFSGHKKKLTGKKALVNAGPTYEPIDPVRFIGNRSSGKMGVAIANALREAGADVTLVLGPSSAQPFKDVQVIEVETAAEMYEACLSRFEDADIVIAAAAVADFTPANPSQQKIKKQSDKVPASLELKPTDDILAAMAANKKPHQIMMGFALETDDELDNARAKLEAKKLDAIVLNSLNDPGAGFQHNTNKITILDRYNNLDNFGLKAKVEVARDIVAKIISLLDA